MCKDKVVLESIHSSEHAAEVKALDLVSKDLTLRDDDMTWYPVYSFLPFGPLGLIALFLFAGKMVLREIC